eukprot:scaffold1251_cov333-Pavlova_lutheri.AAC.4
MTSVCIPPAFKYIRSASRHIHSYEPRRKPRSFPRRRAAVMFVSCFQRSFRSLLDTHPFVHEPPGHLGGFSDGCCAFGVASLVVNQLHVARIVQVRLQAESHRSRLVFDHVGLPVNSIA